MIKALMGVAGAALAAIGMYKWITEPEPSEMQAFLEWWWLWAAAIVLMLPMATDRGKR